MINVEINCGETCTSSKYIDVVASVRVCTQRVPRKLLGDLIIHSL